MPESSVVRNVRLLAQEVYKGGDTSPFAFGDLIGQLLRLTVAETNGLIVVTKSLVENNVFVIDGWKQIGKPIVLNDGSFLVIAFTLFLDQDRKKLYGDRFLRVRKEFITHQLDEVGQAWTFRYDYDRENLSQHPSSHLQVRGRLIDNALPKDRPLQRVHFPTRRFSIESIIRMLIQDFRIESNSDEQLIKEVLSTSEQPFLSFVHENLV